MSAVFEKNEENSKKKQSNWLNKLLLQRRFSQTCYLLNSLSSIPVIVCENKNPKNCFQMFSLKLLKVFVEVEMALRERYISCIQKPGGENQKTLLLSIQSFLVESSVTCCSDL